MTSTAPKKRLFIGLMSGTSLNSIDCGLFDFSEPDKTPVKTVATHEHPLPDDLREELLILCSPGDNEVHRLGIADRKLGELFAQAVNQLLEQSHFSAADVIAIGSHGQTIRHHPYPEPGQPAYSLQIGDPNTLVSKTGIPVVADFRRRDLSLDGQGAPLAPLFHHYALRSNRENRCIVNIGGIANITCLERGGGVSGFDTGPGNVLMNTWVKTHKGSDYDNDGGWASGGKIEYPLLQRFLEDPYFDLAPPKSTGREKFNANWLDEKLQGLTLPPGNVMTTLAELTAYSIAQAIEKAFAGVCGVYLCGGGAHNGYLRRRIQFHLPTCRIQTTSSLGVAEDWVEAATFAWLAKCAIEAREINFSPITGSSAPYRCGAIYFP